MGHDGAENSRNVTGDKCHNQLLGLGAVGTWLRHDVLVEKLHGALEARKLHHCVGDLTHPKRRQSLVEAHEAFALVDERHTSAKSWWRIRGCLNAHLGGFHWSQQHVGEELSRR
jgi:hypothetical protein